MLLKYTPLFKHFKSFPFASLGNPCLNHKKVFILISEKTTTKLTIFDEYLFVNDKKLYFLQKITYALELLKVFITTKYIHIKTSFLNRKLLITKSYILVVGVVTTYLL